jgi:hypothetical protein
MSTGKENHCPQPLLAEHSGLFGGSLNADFGGINFLRFFDRLRH